MSPASAVAARVTVAGVGQPVGVLGVASRLVIAPVKTSSASRIGVSKVPAGDGPAPEIPGTVERSVFPSTAAKSGRSKRIAGVSERKAMGSLFFSCRVKRSGTMFEVVERLTARGITREALVEAGMALYVPHGLEADAARVRLGALLERHLRDPNVAALLIGAILLEEELVEQRRRSDSPRTRSSWSRTRSSGWPSPR